MQNLKPIGAWIAADGVHFRVWAPLAEKVEVVLSGGDSYPMQKQADAYFECVVIHAHAEDRYQFRLNGKTLLPDPASRYQPEGPHGPSQIVETNFAWTDSAWTGVPLDQMVIYELHVGAFTTAGTFAAVEEKLSHLQELGVNAIEILPVAQCPGTRNWGYDGVGLFAVQNTYGDAEIAPRALKHLVNACHGRGIAVILDVVYNHLGPEGNYLPQWGPYFQSKYKTPWGDALNYDGAWSDEVRNYFLQNARQWLEEFHFDGLRLDAIHAILDTSAKPFLEELSTLTRKIEKKVGRRLYLIAESEANDSRIYNPLSRVDWILMASGPMICIMWCTL